MDSLILLIQSIIASYAATEFHPTFEYGMTVAVYVGMFFGALFWGLSADIIGRKYALQHFTHDVLCLLYCRRRRPELESSSASSACMAAFGSGGNLVLDTTVFLEYLPSKYQWTLTMMASWWGAGQFVAGLWAWAFLPNFSCDRALYGDEDSNQPCNWDTNPGWRLCLVRQWCPCVRHERLATHCPSGCARRRKFSCRRRQRCGGRRYDAVHCYKSTKRHCSLTLEQMQACGVTGGALPSNRRGSVSTHASKKASFNEVWMHLKGLFVTRKIALSTCLIWFSWTLIGLAYPLYANTSLFQLLASSLTAMQIQRFPSCVPRNSRRSARWSQSW